MDNFAEEIDEVCAFLESHTQYWKRKVVRDMQQKICELIVENEELKEKAAAAERATEDKK